MSSPHPIDLVLDAWSARSGVAGLDLRLRAYRALSLPGRWDRERLRGTLHAILVLHPEQADTFDDTFDDIFGPEGLPDWLIARLGGEHAPNLDVPRALVELSDAAKKEVVEPAPQQGAESQHAPVEPFAKHYTRPRLWLLVVGAVGALVAIAVLMFVFVHKRPKPSPIIPPPLLPLPPIVEPAVRPPLVVEEPPSEPPRRDGSQPFFLLVLLIPAGLLVWGFLRTRRNESSAFSDETELDLRSPQPPRPIPSRVLDDLSYRVAVAVDPGYRLLDVQATVQATVRQGGFLVLRHKHQRRVSHLAIVMPHSLDDIAVVWFAELAAGLLRRGVPVQIVHVPPVGDWPDLALLAVDARRPNDSHLARWLDAPNLALLAVRDSGLWDQSVARLPFGVFAPDAMGLAAALEAGRRGFRPPPILVESRVAAARLGDALPLAAAAALCAPCDLAALDELRQLLTPHLPFSALQRVLALDGVRRDPSGYSFSSEQTLWLTRRIGPRLRIQALTWHAQRLGKASPMPNSPAAALQSREQVMVALQLAHLRAHGKPVDEVEMQALRRRLRPQLKDPQMRQRLGERATEIGRLMPDLRVETEGTQKWMRQLGIVAQVKPRAKADWVWRLHVATPAAILFILLSFGQPPPLPLEIAEPVKPPAILPPPAPVAKVVTAPLRPPEVVGDVKPRPAPAPSPTPVRPPPPPVRILDSPAFQRLRNTTQPTLAQCLKQDEKAPAQLRLAITIKKDGRMANWTRTLTKIFPKGAVDQCFSDVLNKLSYPAGEDGTFFIFVQRTAVPIATGDNPQAPATPPAVVVRPDDTSFMETKDRTANPADPLPSRILLSERIFFDFDKDNFSPIYLPNLDEVVRVLKIRPDIKRIRIEGHTDKQFSNMYSMDLSHRRAASVGVYLVEHGIETWRLSFAGFGFHCPIAKNDTPNNRALNRRVDIYVIEQDGMKTLPPRCTFPKSIPEHLRP